jgi:hypothetical protein
VIGTIPSGQVATPLQLADGTYTYTSDGYGGGSFIVSGDSTLSLRKADFSGQLKNTNNVSYSMSMVDANGVNYTPGGVKLADGDARARFLLPVQKGDLAYHYTFNVPASYWGSSGDVYIYADKVFQTMSLYSGRTFVIAPKVTLAITVPEGAELNLYHAVRFYEPLETLTARLAQSNGDGSKTYTFDAPSGTYLHYVLELAGYVKKACLFTTSTSDMILSVTKSSLTADTGKDLANSRYAADIIMNAPDSKYITLNSGDEFELYCFRNWQAIHSESGNYYIDPDYKVEVISGNSVTVTNPYYAGATIKATGTGVSIVRVTYGPLDYLDSGGAPYVYSKLWERNTAILVFNVNPTGSATIDTGVTQTEYETAYYTRSINGVEQDITNQYAEYTFTPTVTNGTLKSVCLHAPVGSTDTWDDSDTAWTKLTANSDGSYTVKLTDGRSLVRVTAVDGTVAYHSVKAAGLDITVNSENAQVSLNNGQFTVTTNIDDTVNISFSGLELPFPKLATIYNPAMEI